MATGKNIVVLLSPYISHVISTLKIMRLLRERGYHIIYASEPYMQKAIERYRFTYCHSPLVHQAKARKDASVVKGLLQELVAAYQPVLLIAEVGLWDVALLAMGMQVKVIMLQTWACGDKPAFNTRLLSTMPSIPGRIAEYLKHEAVWLRINARNQLDEYRKNSAHNRYYREITRLAGLPPKRYLSLRNRNVYHRVIGIPELVLYPPELDFPRKLQQGVVFIGPFVEDQREESPFNWQTIDRQRPVVVCSLGSLSHWYDKEKRLSFYTRVIQAFEQRPMYTLLVSVGNFYDELREGTWQDNICLYRSIPQLTLLGKARFFITHGGAGSMKESIFSGVPMLVYPWSSDSDMFGNALRIRYHRLGIIGDIERDAPQDIIGHIRELEQGDYTDHVRKMQKIFLRHQQQEDGAIDLIERTAGVRLSGNNTPVPGLLYPTNP